MNSINLPEALLKEMIPAASALSIRKNVLSTMSLSGVDLTSDNGVAFVDAVVEAQAAYDMLFHRAVRQAVDAGYRPGLDEPLTVMPTRGVATWIPADVPAGEGVTEDADPAAQGDQTAP